MVVTKGVMTIKVREPMFIPAEKRYKNRAWYWFISYLSILNAKFTWLEKFLSLLSWENQFRVGCLLFTGRNFHWGPICPWKISSQQSKELFIRFHEAKFPLENFLIFTDFIVIKDTSKKSSGNAKLKCGMSIKGRGAMLVGKNLRKTSPNLNKSCLIL